MKLYNKKLLYIEIVKEVVFIEFFQQTNSTCMEGRSLQNFCAGHKLDDLILPMLAFWPMGSTADVLCKNCAM